MKYKCEEVKFNVYSFYLILDSMIVVIILIIWFLVLMAQRVSPEQIDRPKRNYYLSKISNGNNVAVKGAFFPVSIGIFQIIHFVTTNTFLVPPNILSLCYHVE